MKRYVCGAHECLFILRCPIRGSVETCLLKKKIKLQTIILIWRVRFYELGTIDPTAPPVGRVQHYSIQQSGVTKNLIGASLVKSVSISLHLDLNSTFHPNSLKCFIKDISHIFSSRQIKRNVCVNVVKWWFRCELEWSITCYCLLTLKQQRKMLFIYQFNLLYIYIYYDWSIFF